MRPKNLRTAKIKESATYFPGFGNCLHPKEIGRKFPSLKEKINHTKYSENSKKKSFGNILGKS